MMTTEKNIMHETIIKQIKRLVAQGHIDEAIKTLVQVAENTPYINNSLLISSRYRKESFNIINGINDSTIELNRISSSILSLSDEILNYFIISENNIVINNTIYGNLEEKETSFEEILWLKIDKYIITEYIHSGGFGSVYKAKHSHLGHTYALKISHEIEEGFDFLDEIVSLGVTGLQLLNHQYIVKTYDIGEVVINSTKRIYLVMEFIDGGTLADIKKTDLRKENVWDRLEIFKKVCSGIHYAHNLKYTNKLGFQVMGLMHGDIKPSNILLTKKGEPKIMDFMFVDMTKLVEIKVKLPKVIERMDAQATQVFGTIGYMPIEQQMDGFVTERTDIYALGILLFEILCPIKFSECKFNTSSQIHSFLLGYNKSIPSFVSKIIFRATKEDQYDRYENLIEIINEIESNSKWYHKIF
jgi:serine/threonine protein kinase